MRVFISCDMEGCTGVVHGDQLVPGGYDYERARKWMTRDVAAAAEGALAVDGVELVRICDGHGTMRNVLIDGLPAGVELVTGPASSRTLCQVEGLDDSFDALVFVGYHAMASTPRAVLPHTWVGSLVSEVRVNGMLFGESALNAALAGSLGIPVVFLSGDDAACSEARALLGEDLATVAVKTAVGSRSAICRTPDVTAADIRSGVTSALRDLAARSPFVVATPVAVTIAFHRSEMADRAMKRAGPERISKCEVTYTSDTAFDAVREAWAVIEGAAAEHPEWLR